MQPNLCPLILYEGYSQTQYKTEIPEKDIFKILLFYVTFQTNCKNVDYVHLNVILYF